MINDTAVTARLVDDEGEVLHAYQDHLGFWTIGVGILIDQRKGGGITQEESRYLLRNRIRRKTAECEARFDWWASLDEVRQGVIVCMAFQLGVNGVSNFRKMTVAIKVRDYLAAANEMLDSNWYRQTPARCRRMANIMATGEWQ